MATRALNRRESFLLRHAPILLAVSLVWFVLTLRGGPILVPYVLWWFAIGLLYSICAIFGYWKNQSPLLGLLSTLILWGGGFFLPKILFAWATPSDWFRQSQGISILFVCLFTLCWTLRRKMFAPNRDVEQIVGPERRERVSHQTWRGEG
jgi:hypothetical protein